MNKNRIYNQGQPSESGNSYDDQYDKDFDMESPKDVQPQGVMNFPIAQDSGRVVPTSSDHSGMNLLPGGADDMDFPAKVQQ